MSARDDIARAVAGKRPSRTGWVRACCPSCEERQGTPDRKFSLGVHLPTGGWNCFRCGSRGRLGDAHAMVEVEEPPPPPAVEPPEAFYRLHEGPGATARSLDGARDYVRRRGISDEVARAVQIGACTRGKFYGRVVVPVFGSKGEWLWHVGRDITNTAMRRYLYPSGARVGVMFNGAALDVETDVPLLAVEGCFDALPHWPHAAAFLGKPTEPHVDRLLLARRPVCVVLDGDAWEEGEALAWRLRVEGVRAGCLRLSPMTDPNNFGARELMEAARNSLDA